MSSPGLRNNNNNSEQTATNWLTDEEKMQKQIIDSLILIQENLHDVVEEDINIGASQSLRSVIYKPSN